MDLDRTLCYCHKLTKRKIVNFIRQTRPRKASQISECFEAGSGCGWCIPSLIRLHREILGGEEVKEESLSPEEAEALRARYIQGVKEGTGGRNNYAPRDVGDSREEETSDGRAGGEAPSTGRSNEKDFDYTRYFSRPRPDPDPETLE